jgi:hypothetical protein
MLKADVLAQILVRAEWVRDLEEGRSLVAREFNRHRPKGNMAEWNTHVGEVWASAYIARATATRPDQIRFNQAFDELDSAT